MADSSDDSGLDVQRLQALVEELGSKASYAFGERRVTPPVAPVEAVAIVEALSGEVDSGVAERARLARAQQLRIHCHEGCDTCCNVVVMVHRPESLRVAALLASDEGAEARAHFAATYPRWKAGLADVLPELTALSSARDQKPYFSLLHEATRRRVMCAFNQGGRCTVYPARPLGCRDAHALDTEEHCVSRVPMDHPQFRKSAALAFEPLDRLTVSAARLLRAVHNQMEETSRHHASALCQDVARLIGIEEDQGQGQGQG